MELEVLDLKYKNSLNVFNKLKDEVLEVLKDAYGERYFGDSFTINRLILEKHTLILAKKINRVIGISHIRPDGKRSGFAIHTEHQNKGLGTVLIEKSLSIFPFQFTEIYPDNYRMEHLLTKCDFKINNDKSSLNEFLKEDAKNVKSLIFIDNRLTYTRESFKHDKPITHDFVMYHHPSKT